MHMKIRLKYGENAGGDRGWRVASDNNMWQLVNAYIYILKIIYIYIYNIYLKIHTYIYIV
jgi:hypothetical protein